MILKIERHKEDRDWWIIDGIRRVSMHKPREYKTLVDREELEVWNFDTRILDNLTCACLEGEECSNCPSPEYKKNYKVLPMDLRLDNGDTSLLLFDTVAYLLNDQGKTVERIVVNFPVLKDDGSKR